MPNDGGYGYIFQTALTFFREKISDSITELIKDILKSSNKTMFQGTYLSIWA